MQFQRNDAGNDGRRHSGGGEALHGRIGRGHDGVPEGVGAMMAAGIERDCADLVRAEKTWFLPDG